MGEKGIAVRAATEAGRLLMGYFCKNIGFEYKKGKDIVTKADREAERLVLKILKSKCPKYNYLSEETGREYNSSEHTWVIDPLDGTMNFLSGIPFFAVSIGLLLRGKPILGVIYDPLRKEIFLAERGKGTTLNGMPARVSERKDLRDSIIFHFSGMEDKNTQRFLRFLPKIHSSFRGVRTLGSCALAMAYVSCGRAEAYAAIEELPWDVAAGYLIVTEAGGEVTDLNGKDINIESKEIDILVSNGKIHGKVLEILKGKNERKKSH